MKSQKISQLDLALCFLRCRDAWDAAVPDANVRAEPFGQFVKWVINANRSDSVPTPPAVNDVLAMITRPNRHDAYCDEDLRARLNGKSNGRTFRLSAAVDVRSQDSDRRVRSLFEFIESGKVRLTLTGLLSPFFTETGTVKSRGRNITFVTATPTRLQQLLYICSIVLLTDIFQNRSKRNVDGGAESSARKRRKTSSTTSEVSRNGKVSGPSKSKSENNPIPGLKCFGIDTSQRVGYAIQRIVEGWDSFAQHLGFESVEQMMLPYARVTSPPLHFQAIETRDEGFVPSSQALNLQVNIELSSVPGQMFPHVLDRPVQVDQMIRILVRDFLADIDKAVRSSRLYTKTPNETWSYLESFNHHGNHIPERFTSYSSTTIATVRNHIRTERGGAGVDSTHHASPSLAAGGTDNDQGSDDVIMDEANASGSGDAQRDDGGQGSGVAKNAVPIVTDAEMVNKMHILNKEMAKTVALFDCDFRKLISTNTSIGREELEEHVQLILTDPPYNVRKNKEAPNSEHDLLTAADMKEFVDVVDQLLRPGGHAIIFCTVQQFPQWERYFHRVKSETGDNSFMVSPTPMIFAYHPSVSNGFPGRKSCALTNAAEFAIHVKKNGLKFEEEEKMVNYKTFGYVPSRYPPFRNVIDNVMGHVLDERLMVPKDRLDEESPSEKPENKSKIRTQMLRPEQKCLTLLQELLCRFSNKGDVVVDPFGGTFATAIACLTLPEHRQFVGCERDSKCFKWAEDFVIKNFAGVIAKGDTDISVSGTAIDASRRIVDKLAVTAKPTQSNSRTWYPPSNLPPYQTLPPHIVGYLSSAFNDPSIFSTCGNLPLHQWPRVYRGLLERADPESLLKIDAAANHLVVAKSTVKHPNAGRGVFATTGFVRGDRIAAYFGTLVYHNLSTRTLTQKMYGKGIMGVNVERFKNYGLQVNATGNAFSRVASLNNKKPERKSVSIVPPPFCVAGLINDFRYLSDDEDHDALIEKRLAKPREANVIFVQKQERDVTTARQLLPYDVSYIEAITTINAGEEIFIHYGPDFFKKLALAQ